MTTAQDLREAAINNSNICTTDWRVAEAFLVLQDRSHFGENRRDLHNRTFLLIVACALDGGEPGQYSTLDDFMSFTGKCSYTKIGSVHQITFREPT